MRILTRLPIPGHLSEDLAGRQELVNDAVNPKPRANLEWKRFQGVPRKAIKAKLVEMASGMSRCMYCEDSMGTDIDHFRPKGVYPDSAFIWENFLLACSHCNSNRKRDLFPVVGGIAMLINPATDDPGLHMQYSPSTGKYLARTDRGQASIDVYGLNREICEKGRQNAWVAICSLASAYKDALDEGDSDQARKILDALAGHPFQGLLGTAVRLCELASPPCMTLSARDAFRDLEALRMLA